MYCVLQNERSELLFILEDTKCRKIDSPVLCFNLESKTAVLHKNPDFFVNLDEIDERIQEDLQNSKEVYVLERSAENQMADNYVAQVKLVN